MSIEKVRIHVNNNVVFNALEEAARISGMPIEYLYAVAKQESGLRPTIKASTSSATGLFQFIRSTWQSMINKYGAKYNISLSDITKARENAIMGGLFMRDNYNALKRSTGRDPDLADLYCAHFSGVGTAIKAMRAGRSASASGVWGKAAIRANPTIFKNNTVGSVLDTLARKVLRYYKEVM